MRNRTNFFGSLLAAVVVVLLILAVPTQAWAAVEVPDAPAQTAFNRATDKCPCCNAVVTDWTELPNITSNSNLAGGHYVVSQPLTMEAYYNITGTKKVVLVVESTLTAKSGSNALRAGVGASDDTLMTQLWLLGGTNGKITGTGMTGTSGAATRNGSLMRFGPTATVVIGGDLTVELSGTATSGRGGLFDVYKSNVTMIGGTLNGITSEATVDTYGAVVVRAGGSFTMTGGIINGGNVTQGGAIEVSTEGVGGTVTIGGNAYINCAGKTVTNGGAIYIAEGSLDIQGGTIIGGNATGGGAIYSAANTVTMSGGAVYGGSATNGGAIYVESGTATISGGTVYGGSVTNGGAIYMESGTATISGGTVYGGTASSGGGAIYMKAGRLNLTGATVTGGSAKNGGGLYMDSGTTCNMSSGEMKLGTATSQGAIGFIKGTFNMSGGTITANGAATCNARGLRIHDGTVNLSGNANIISCAKSTGDGLNVVSASKTATVTLDGNAQVWGTDSKIGYNIMFHNYHNGTNYVPTMLTVKSGWTGKASVRFGHITDGLDSYAPGGTISDAYASSEGPYTGQLYLENEESLPRIYGRNTSLGYIGVELQTRTGLAKNSQWFEDNAQAVAAYAAEENENKLLRLYTDEDLNLAGNEVYVDFNGHAVEVKLNGGKLYGFDSTGTTAEPGKALADITDGAAQRYAENPINGSRYIALQEESTGFHKIEVDIVSANVRPSEVGMYYTAKIACDEMLKPYVTQLGVAVSLVDMPGEDFATDSNTLYVAHPVESLGQEGYTSVLVNKIMSQEAAAQNKKRAEKPIYANAYVQLKVEDLNLTLMANTTTDLSLKSAMQRINNMWADLAKNLRGGVLENIYKPYISQFATNDWNLRNMEAELSGAPGTKELKILTIGNSLSVDATRMLAYIAQQEGSEGIKIGTLYHANCSLQEHADFLVNDKAEYWYYESGFDAETAATLAEGSLVPKETKSYIGKDAIVAQDWDIIIMQHAVFQSGDPDTYDDSIETIIRYVNANKTNPNAVFAWNMTWMGPVDKDLLATSATSSPGFEGAYQRYTKATLDREAQTMMYEKIVSAVQSKITNSGAFVYLLPSATMMQNALNATSDKVMYRDYIHGSDYGRLMNGYLWYSILTGKTIESPAVTKIPGALRYASADRASDLSLTQRQIDILVEAVNNAIASPFTATDSQYSKEGEFNVLAIGNSFAQDTTFYLEDIARAQGYTNVNIAYLYIGGCTLKTHATNMEGNLAKYTYYTNFNGSWVSTANSTMAQAITSRKWDAVTLQQGSANSGQSSTYEPYLGKLVDYIQKEQPDAKILWHMTWAYQSDSTHSSFPNYNNDQATMYNAILDAYDTAVKPYLTSGDIDGLLACGTAIQNARTSYVGDNLTRDGYHLSPLGRYLTGCLWYSILTGETLTELDLTKTDSKLTLTDRDKAMVIEAVTNAINTPTAITQSNDPA